MNKILTIQELDESVNKIVENACAEFETTKEDFYSGLQRDLNDTGLDNDDEMPE